MQLIKERGSTWGHQRESFKVCLKQKQGRNLFLCWHVHKVFLEGYEKSVLSFLGRGPDSVLRGRGGALGTSQTCSSAFCFVLDFVLQAFLVTEPRTGVTGSRGQALGFTILSHMGPGGRIGP